MSASFPSPFDIEMPAGAAGWEELYTDSLVFSEDRRAYEEGTFWFHDAVHFPEPLSPWDTTLMEYGFASLGQYNTRTFVVPPALGVDYRVLGGYVFLSPVPVADPAEIEARVPHFMERAGFYFQNWDELYARWMEKMRTLIDELEALTFQPLPEREPLEVVTSGRGTGSGYDLQVAYHRLLDLAHKVWQYHFEFLNLGYAAYLDFFGFCKQAFPSIADLAIAKMVAGIEVDLFRPDEELKGLARAAVELGVDGTFAAEDAEQVLAELARTPAGKEWLSRFDAAKDPWFNFSSGSGFFHTDKVWIEHLAIPFGFIRNYVDKVKRGVAVERPVEEIRAERDRIVAGYLELLGSDEDRAAFEAKLGLARMVFPYVENHNFYVEHWAQSVIWRKMRDLGRILEKEGVVTEVDDVFYLHRDEVPTVIFDLYKAWAVGAEPRGPKKWPAELNRRKGIVDELRRWRPPKALGRAPETVTEPFTVMLWGITNESIKQWTGGDGETDRALTGFAASPGVAEGRARVVFSAEEIGGVEEGEILVAPLTAPSWAPIFDRIGATVTDVGGIMSHAAIVCREYGLPAVTGTGLATSRITTGQRIRVDGSNGTVTILD